MTDLPEIGDVIDDTYEIQSVLGTGGFGAVYRARQINMDRDVALKLLVASGAKFDEMVKRFRREVMAIRNLTHPNTIRVYDFRDNPDGLLYYTMEALDGRTLKDEVLQRGTLSPRRLKGVLRQVLKSLSEAHSYTIVHRDLKPANIMLVDMHGETDFVKVLDFGIAKVLQDAGEEGKEDLTSAGILVGTLRYMAPEQITGEPLGPQTDLYALGLIAVEMLTGDSVFAGTGRWEVLQQQISEEPVAIPDAVMQSGLGGVIRKCLEKRPEPRFSTADEVIHALDAINDSDLDDEALFYRDGEGGWLARNAEERQLLEVEPLAEAEQREPSSFASGDGVVVGGDGTSDLDAKTVLTHVDELPSAEFRIDSPSPSERTPSPSPTPAPVPAPSANSMGANPSFARDNTDQVGFTPAKKNSSGGLLLWVAILLVISTGGGFVIWKITTGDGEPEEFSQGSEVEPEPELEEVEPVAPPPSEEVEGVPTRTVVVDVDGVRARAYIDDMAMGRTPYSAEFSEDGEVVLVLKARGYEDASVTLDGESPEMLNVEMEEIVEEQQRADRGSSVGAREEPSSGTSAASGGSRPDRQPTREPESEPSGGGDDWVDIPSGTDPVADEGGSESSSEDDWLDISSEPDEEEEVPLF